MSPQDAKHTLNPSLIGFACIRCSAKLPIGDYFEGCPTCQAEGQPSSVVSEFRALPKSVASPSARGMGRYAAWLPYSSWVSLGEGATSCLSFARLAEEVGIERLFIKNEGQNPSGSHKDRVSCLTVTRALDTGATRLVAASSGNGGASLALYAAAAGLACSIVVTPALSSIHRRAIALTGADLIVAEDTMERWALVAKMARGRDCFPATNYLAPPVGSNHFGVEGLKTVAFELVEDIGPIDAVLVPTSRGDLVWGLYAGFQQMIAIGSIERMPRLFVVEPFARLSKVLDGAEITGSFSGATSLFSIGGSTVTYQAVEAVHRSGGGAVVIDDAAVIRDASRLARHGCYAELSSAATLTGVETLLRQGKIRSDETVALIATSNGYKDLPNAVGLP